MGENQRRRQARRQPRGLRRVEEILDAAAQVFAEVGYDEASANTIAGRAAMSPGSLYQFFPNKEAIARALAARYAEDLLRLHSTGLAPEAVLLPLAAFLDRMVDPIVAYNRAHPALTRLFGAAHGSPHLAGMLDELHGEVVQRLDAALAAREPRLDPARRQRVTTVLLRTALALLPLTLDPDPAGAQAMLGELKAILFEYLASVLDSVARDDRPASRAGLSGTASGSLL
jgi:AcrR family transcriptional regulator